MHWLERALGAKNPFGLICKGETKKLLWRDLCSGKSTLVVSVPQSSCSTWAVWICCQPCKIPWRFSSLCVIQRCSRKVEIAQGWLNSWEHFPASNHVCLILGLNQWSSVLKPLCFLPGLSCSKTTPDLLLLAKLPIFNIILFLVSLIFSCQRCL